jgi:integrase
MAGKRTPGMYQGKDERWSVDKIYRGVRLRCDGFESAGAAEDWILERVAEIRKRPRGVVTFNAAATHYLDKNRGKISIELEVHLLKQVMPFIGHLPIEQVDDETLEPFVKAMKAGQLPATKPLAAKSINLALGMVRQILNLCARSYRTKGKPWLHGLAPLITMVESKGKREPMQLTWPKQRELLPTLPKHLANMALFKLNSGVRESPVCRLEWEWEVKIPDLGFSVFVVPKRWVKGRKRDRVLVCNSVAQRIIESVRGQHPKFVFVYSRIRKAGKDPVYRPVGKMNNTAWQKGRGKVGMPKLAIHHLRHTVGMRLREAGVEARTISDILWHEHDGMTAHYSVAQVVEIREALEKIVDEKNVSNVSLASIIELSRVPGNVPGERKTA